MSRLSRNRWLWLALGLSLALAVFISPLASSSPDGLEKVAETKGFDHQAAPTPVWRGSILPDYGVPGMESETLSTGLSGLLGTLIVFGLTVGGASLVAKHKRDKG